GQQLSGRPQPTHRRDSGIRPGCVRERRTTRQEHHPDLHELPGIFSRAADRRRRSQGPCHAGCRPRGRQRRTGAGRRIPLRHSPGSVVMAHIVALVASHEESFVKHIGRMLRSGAIPVSLVDERVARDLTTIDVFIVDARGDASAAMANIERVRGTAPNAGVFAVADTNDPNLILQSMRAGANEFFTWPPDSESFHGAIRRTAARRESAHGSRPAATTLVFFGAKGGAGTTTIAVNCGVELARLSKRPTVIVDLKPGLGEVGLFLGIRPRFSILDGIDNLHRLDREFLKELVVTHKSGLEILAGSDQFDRPGAQDASAIEELFRLLTRQYEYILVDAGSQINSCSVAALYTADQMFVVANPDVPSVRNAQRILDRVRQLG